MNAPEYGSDRDYNDWLNGPEEREQEEPPSVSLVATTDDWGFPPAQVCDTCLLLLRDHWRGRACPQ